LILPVEPILLMLNLESRGISVEVDGDDLLVGPREWLTDDDRAALRRWKRDVRTIADYATTATVN
jgi:cation transport ATPase